MKNPMSENLQRAYRELQEGLSDMIESGRLKEADIPEDYNWLVESLAKLAGLDPRKANERCFRLIAVDDNTVEQFYILAKDEDEAKEKAMPMILDALSSRSSNLLADYKDFDDLEADLYAFSIEEI